MSENNFSDRTKWQEKRPKYAGPIYFHADVCQRTIFEIARNGTKKGPNTPAQFISTRIYVREQFLRSHEMAQKRPKYAGPIYFHADVCQKTIFGDRTKWHEKRPKYAGPIYFHADVCQRTIFEITRKGTKKAQVRRPNLFSRGCMSENNFW